MSEFLDYLVSTSWLKITVFFFLLFAITGIWFVPIFRNKIISRIFNVTFGLASFAFLMYIVMGPSGYAVNFIYGLTNGKEICLVETHWKSAGEGDSYEAYRLYVLNLETGERIYRMSVDSPEILYVSDDGVIFFEWTFAVEYDLKEGNKVREWTTTTGFEEFPELRVGISDLNRQGNNSPDENEAYLTLTAMDGHKYCYDFASDELIAAEYLNNDLMAQGCRFDDYGVYCYDENRNEEFSFRFRDKTGEIDELYKHQYPEPDKVFHDDFLRPQVVALYEEEEFFVIQDFETLDETNAILTAISFDLHEIWKIAQSELDVKDSYDDKPVIGPCIRADDKLIVTYGGFVVCLNALSGETIWKSLM